MSALEQAVEFENPDQRLACILVLDTSGSMMGEKIDALNRGLADFKQALLDDPSGFAPSRVEVAVLAFDNRIQLLHDFSLPGDFEPPVLTAQGQTYLGTAVLDALQHLETRKEAYKAGGLPYNRPWLFLITDGVPQGESPDKIQEAGAALRKAEADKRVIAWTVGVGEEVDYNLMEETFGKKPAKMKGVNFSEMFKWLSASTSRASGSSAGEKVDIAPPEWCTFDA